MGGPQQLQQAFLAGGGKGLQIAFEGGLEGLLLLPRGMFRYERLDAVHSEGELEVHGLLGPERAVVVEHGDAHRGWHEVGGALLRHLCHEGDDRLLSLAIVPGGERVNGLCVRRGTDGQTDVSKG